jgi:hypothetical protein
MKNILPSFSIPSCDVAVADVDDDVATAPSALSAFERLIFIQLHVPDPLHYSTSQRLLKH